MTRLTLDNNINIQLVKKIAKNQYPNQPYLAALTATQAILESGLRDYKPSQLALLYCNLFGIKAGDGTMFPEGGTDGTVDLGTDEYDDAGVKTHPEQLFVANNNIEDSFAQHKQLFMTAKRYANLSQANSFAEIARMVQADGYATDPKYSDLLIQVYNEC